MLLCKSPFAELDNLGNPQECCQVLPPGVQEIRQDKDSKHRCHSITSPGREQMRASVHLSFPQAFPLNRTATLSQHLSSATGATASHLHATFKKF